MLVENSTTESISEMDTLLGNATNIQESIISFGITSTVQTVLMQCSTKIFKVLKFFFKSSLYVFVMLMQSVHFLVLFLIPIGVLYHYFL